MFLHKFLPLTYLTWYCSGSCFPLCLTLLYLQTFYSYFFSMLFFERICHVFDQILPVCQQTGEARASMCRVGFRSDQQVYLLCLFYHSIYLPCGSFMTAFVLRVLSQQFCQGSERYHAFGYEVCAFHACHRRQSCFHAVEVDGQFFIPFSRKDLRSRSSAYDFLSSV